MPASQLAPPRAVPIVASTFSVRVAYPENGVVGAAVSLSVGGTGGALGIVSRRRNVFHKTAQGAPTPLGAPLQLDCMFPFRKEVLVSAAVFLILCSSCIHHGMCFSPDYPGPN